MIKDGAILELIRPGPYYWSTPEFHRARADLEKASSRTGPFEYDGNVTISVAASGRGEAATWMVMKTEDGRMKFKSQATGDEEEHDSVSSPSKSNADAVVRLTFWNRVYTVVREELWLLRVLYS